MTEVRRKYVLRPRSNARYDAAKGVSSTKKEAALKASDYKRVVVRSQRGVSSPRRLVLLGLVIRSLPTQLLPSWLDPLLL
jgi:hypothetical protein